MTQTRQIRSIPLEQWPVADRLAFERALAPDDDGSGEHGRAAHLRAATIESYSQTYGQYLDFLDRTDALVDSETIVDRTTPPRVSAWRRENKARGLAPTSRRNLLRNLSAMLRLLAPNRDWRFVARPGGISLNRAIRGGAKSVVVRDVAEVMVQVRRLHREALALAASPRKWRALRDAALLAILLSRAPRLRSLWEMTTDRHLEPHADGSWTLRFPGEHTKNGRTLDLPLDAETSRMLTAYLELARSRFRGAGSTDRVWLGMRGAMTRSAIRGIVERHTFGWYGEAHGPHDFRKWLRASAARRSPELAMDSADVMGHSAEVSVQYYAEASCLHAALRHGDRIAERRARLAGRAERALAAELERWEEGYR